MIIITKKAPNSSFYVYQQNVHRISAAQEKTMDNLSQETL